MEASLPRFWIERGVTHRSPGLVRALAEYLFGSQDVAALTAAREWLAPRRDSPGEAVLDILLAQLSPRLAIEKSPENAASDEALARLAKPIPTRATSTSPAIPRRPSARCRRIGSGSCPSIRWRASPCWASPPGSTSTGESWVSPKACRRAARCASGRRMFSTEVLTACVMWRLARPQHRTRGHRRHGPSRSLALRPAGTEGERDHRGLRSWLPRGPGPAQARTPAEAGAGRKAGQVMKRCGRWSRIWRSDWVMRAGERSAVFVIPAKAGMSGKGSA